MAKKGIGKMHSLPDQKKGPKREWKHRKNKTETKFVIEVEQFLTKIELSLSWNQSNMFRSFVSSRSIRKYFPVIKLSSSEKPD